MNKVYFFVVIGFIVAGCSKTNSPVPNSDNALTGKWQLVVDSATVYVNGVFDYNLVETSSTLYYQFNADLSGSEFERELIKFTYNLNNKQLIITLPDQLGSLGNHYDARSDTALVKQVTSNSLILYTETSITHSGETSRQTTNIYLKK